MDLRRASKVIFLAVSLITFAALGAAAPQAAHPAKASPAPRDSIVLNSETTILVSPDQPGPVVKAAQDLASDMGKIFGKKPKIVSRAQDAGFVTIEITELSKLPETLRPTGPAAPESFSFSAVTRKEGNSTLDNEILLAGADMRGTIYAIYQFSQEFLGVDPMYYWTDQEPTRRAQIVIPISRLGRQYPAPLFKYRGFFINDEDLLTGWAPGEEKDHTSISLAVWDKIFETILRLKGNVVAPGTWIFPDDPQVKAAGERGLIITQHHAIPLGMNVARWPDNVPYSYTEHPEILERAWKNAVAEYPPDQEVLWTVGLRGLSDASYAAFDPSVRDNDKALGELITKAIADQIGIVRAVRPDAKVITSLWQEGARLVQEGHLKIPPEVGTVWADTGYGYMQDKGLVTKGQGAYFHVAMYNANANQLTEMVPMARVNEELGRYIKAGATNYLLINTSDIRPVAMMTEAVMNVGWGGVTESDDAFYKQWSTAEFGKKAAPAAAEIYEEYFQAPAHLPFGESKLEVGDNYYHTQARQLLLTYMVGSPLYFLPGQSPKWRVPRVINSFRGQSNEQWLPGAIKADSDRCAEAQLRWDAVWKKALAAEPLVAPARQPFYRADVLTMIVIHRESNRMLRLVAKAVDDARNGRKAQARAEAKQALAAIDEIKKSEAAAEYGKWENWYRGDWLTGIDRTRELLQDFLRFLDDPLSHMTAPINWTGWEAYYHIMHYEGDRSADVK
ncbi:MAG: glycosyl hydrolase 115 family protein [Deltaproteobacteria bacterium]